MAEPNHELTDSEAQAFQAEPHLQHLLKRLQPGSAIPPASSGRPADRLDPSSEPDDKGAGGRPKRPSDRNRQ